MCEILAPAGNEQAAIAAIESGADAIYLGYSVFSARASAENFDLDSLNRIVTRAHLLDVKVYVTMNTVVKDSELDEFFRTLLAVRQTGVDAFILQDGFLGAYLHRLCPEITLHLSTQAGVHNLHGALLAKEQGFSRVILARETPVDDIRKISEAIETEVFIQGALCSCFSGQCYFSSFIGGNSGNRGRCKQPCRKLYTYDRKGYNAPAYALSLSDLSVGARISELKAAGVSSFKIEGRMRRPEYVAAAVAYYRTLLSGKDAQTAYHALKRTYNRGNYTQGLAFGQDKSLLSRTVQGHIGEAIGVLEHRNKGWLCRSKEQGESGDAYKILRNGFEVCGAVFLSNAENGFYLKPSGAVQNGDVVCITTDASLTFSAQRRRRIVLSLSFAEGALPKAKWNGVTVSGEAILQSAKSAPLTEAEILRCFAKTDEFPFAPECKVAVQGNCFLQKSALNAFRRKVYGAIAEALLRQNRTDAPPISLPAISSAKPKGELAVIATEFRLKTQIDYAIFKPNDYTDEGEYRAYFDFAKKYAKHTCLYLPACFTDADEGITAPYFREFEYLYTEGTYGLHLAAQYGKKLFAGVGFNCTNRLDVLDTPFVLSKELTASEQQALLNQNAFVLQCGDLKLMDFVYCPFEKSCKDCDRRNVYHVTDENGRSFPVRRYRLSDCRFELYNCTPLVSQGAGSLLLDLTLTEAQQEVVNACRNPVQLKTLLGRYTTGHEKNGIL